MNIKNIIASFTIAGIIASAVLTPVHAMKRGHDDNDKNPETQETQDPAVTKRIKRPDDNSSSSSSSSSSSLSQPQQVRMVPGPAMPLTDTCYTSQAFEKIVVDTFNQLHLLDTIDRVEALQKSTDDNNKQLLTRTSYAEIIRLHSLFDTTSSTCRKYVIQHLVHNIPTMQRSLEPRCICILQDQQSTLFHEITPDSKKVITTTGSAAHVWDLETGTCLHTLQGNFSYISLAQDSSKAILTSADNTAHIFDLNTGKRRCILHGHNSNFVATISLDGSIAITRPNAQTVCVWDINSNTSKCRYTLQLAAHIARILITPDKSKIIALAHDNTIHIWDFATGKDLKTIQAHDKSDCFWIHKLIITPDSSKIITVSFDGTVRFWDLTSWNCLHTIHGYPNSYDIAIAPDCSFVIIKTDTNVFRVWDLASGNYRPFILRGRELYNNGITQDGSKVLTYDNKTIRVWDLKTGKCLHAFQCLVDISEDCDLRYISDNNSQIITEHGNKFMVWNIDTGSCLYISSSELGYHDIAVAPDGSKAVSWHQTFLRVFDTSYYNLNFYQLALTITLQKALDNNQQINLTDRWQKVFITLPQFMQTKFKSALTAQTIQALDTLKAQTTSISSSSSSLSLSSSSSSLIH
jgi:WD40 repeat protein